MTETPIVRFVSGYYLDSDGETQLLYEDRPYEDMEDWSHRVYEEDKKIMQKVVDDV